MTLKPFPLSLATITAILYIAGYTVAQFHAATLGLGAIELLRSDYLTTGVVVLALPMLLLALFAWSRYHFDKLDEVPGHLLKVSRLIGVAITVGGIIWFCIEVSGACAQLAGPEADAASWKKTFVLQGLAALAFFIAPIAVAGIPKGEVHWSRWAVRATVLLPLTVLYLQFSSTHIYPILPRSLGGARPTAIRLQLDDSLHLGATWPIAADGWLDSCTLLSKSATELLIEKDGRRLLLPASKVKATEFITPVP